MRVGHRTTVNLRVNAFLLARHVSASDSFGAAGQSAPTQGGSDPQILGPLEPLRVGATGDLIFAELLAHEERRSAALLEYTAVKRHQVFDSGGEMYAEEITQINYHAPDKKTIVVTSQKGWGPGGHFTFYQVVASEVEAAATEEDRESSITPAKLQVGSAW